jgi:Tol biopolymer transport system component
MGWTGTSSDLVKQELERVLQSKAFRNADALSKLLRFIVERTLEGDTEGLKEYSLGSQVLDRGPGFDPQADPIVRVQAGRLRSKLDGYYHTEGKNDALRIDLPRGGYIPEFTSAKPADDSIDRDQPSKRGSRLTVLALLGLLAFGSAIATWFLVVLAKVEPSPGVMRVALGAPADFSISWFAISPDGRTLAMVVSGKGKTQLCLRPMDSLEPRMVPGTQDAQLTPFWSPDSRSIGFFASGELKKLDSVTGVVQTICRAPLGRGGTWNQDGRIVFSPGIQDPLFRVNALGGAPVQITKLDAGRHEESHRSPWFLPDGRRFLYHVRASQQENSGLYLGDLDGRPPKKLLPAESEAVFVSPGYLMFIRQRILFAQRFNPRTLDLAGEPTPITGTSEGDYWRFSASNSGIVILQDGRAPRARGNSLVWMDRSGNQRTSIGRIARSRHISLSADGSKVAYDHPAPPSGAAAVSVFDVRRGTSNQLTFPPAISDTPVISRDGRQVVFRSNPNGQFDLFVKDLTSATDSRLLLHSAESKYPTDWSPEAKTCSSTDWNQEETKAFGCSRWQPERRLI